MTNVNETLMSNLRSTASAVYFIASVIFRKDKYEASKKSEHVLPQVQKTHQARCREGKEEEG